MIQYTTRERELAEIVSRLATSVFDLRESGVRKRAQLKQDSDLVMFIYRDEYYDRESEREGIADLIISKHRNGGLGTVELAFQKEFPRFMSYAGEEGY